LDHPVDIFYFNFINDINNINYNFNSWRTVTAATTPVYWQS